jgi:hypothetical protein
VWEREGQRGRKREKLKGEKQDYNSKIWVGSWEWCKR